MCFIECFGQQPSDVIFGESFTLYTEVKGFSANYFPPETMHKSFPKTIATFLNMASI